MIGISWWSGGVTSAVATKLALEKYHEVQIYFCETGQHHPDNIRFLKDCEKWYDQNITILNNKKWGTVENIIRKCKHINGPNGADCTRYLKKDVRVALEKIVPYDFQVFGFEFSPAQIKRAKRFGEQYPDSKAVFPLIEQQINKLFAMQHLVDASIDLPAMYKLGYNNANCIGCVKGGMGYWNKIRNDFPEIFKRTAEIERANKRTCIKGVYLDELDPQAGRHESIELPECGTYCQVEMMGLE